MSILHNLIYNDFCQKKNFSGTFQL
jgi:hypothetical protein